MNDVVLARIDPAEPDTVRWRSDGKAWHSGGFQEFAAVLGERACMLLVDGASVTLLEAELPVKDLKTARQAAPYAVEERLAQALDDLHFSVQAIADGRYAILVAARTHIESLTRALAQWNIRPQLITVEYSALPVAAASWTISVEHELATLRLSEYAGIKVPLSELGALVPLLRREYAHTARAIVYSDEAPKTFPSAAFQGLQLEWRPALNTADMLAELERTAQPALFDASNAALARARGRRLWRVVALAAVLLALAYPAMLALHHSILSERHRALAAANVTLFRSAFPDITRVVNPRVQAEQALTELRGRAVKVPRFLDLLASIDAVRAEHFPATTRVANASYGGGVIELGIETAGMDAVETVRTALKQEGMRADTLSAEAAEDKIVARLRVMEGG